LRWPGRPVLFKVGYDIRAHVLPREAKIDAELLRAQPTGSTRKDREATEDVWDRTQPGGEFLGAIIKHILEGRISGGRWSAEKIWQITVNDVYIIAISLIPR
jgi:hypothetical protein